MITQTKPRKNRKPRATPKASPAKKSPFSAALSELLEARVNTPVPTEPAMNPVVPEPETIRFPPVRNPIFNQTTL